MTCEVCGGDVSAGARFCSNCGNAVARSAPPGDPLREALQDALAPQIEIVRMLGRGGMGAVYLGRDVALEREVAIKALPLEMARTKNARERFVREARIAASLSHPHIVPLYSFGQTNDLLYYVMGYVAGETLAARLSRDRTLASDVAQRILSELAGALAYAHEHGIIHRDLKPENILLDDRTGAAILTDFGIARREDVDDGLTRPGSMVGTPQYMSPEQAMGQPVDFRSDLYSLGVVGYRMITGELPLQAASLEQLIALHMQEAPSIAPMPSDTPRPLADAMVRCLRKDPAERWPSALELRDALSDEASVALPEELRNFASRGLYFIPMLLLALLLAPFETSFWDLVDPGWRMVILLLQFTPVIFVFMTALALAEGRKAGLSRPAVLQAVFQSPDGYIGWVPRRMRKAHDLWEQLPSPMRRMRIMISVMCLFSVTGPPVLGLEIVAEQRLGHPGRLFFIGYAILLVAVLVVLIAFVVQVELLLASDGLNAKQRSRFLGLPTARSKAWRTPEGARILALVKPIVPAVSASEKTVARS